MKINMHAGHNPDGKVACGATGFLKESVRFEFRGNVRARQLGEAHFHVGVVGDGALAVRHGHFAVFDEDDFRCRFRQDFGEQVGFAASCHFVVDVSLGEWQERQGLRQCQW